jgi:hypothetical protein
MGAADNLRDLDALAAVFVAREGRLLGALAAQMSRVSGGPAVFEIWMKRESDLVQARDPRAPAALSNQRAPAA